MKRHREIGAIAFGDDTMSIEIDGTMHTFKLSDISRNLAHTNQVERERYEVSPSGYGIHWPLIDEDLSVDGLLNVRLRHPLPAKRRGQRLTVALPGMRPTSRA